MFVNILQLLLVTFAAVLLIQAIFNIYTTLYIWDDPDRLRRSKAPRKMEKPKHGFTVLLPARHEAAVIGETLHRLSKVKYPKSRYELMVICTKDDKETIRAAREAKKKFKIRNAKIVIFAGKPGKSRGMNIALSKAKFDLVTIFDSEDDVSEQIFNIANTLFIRRDIDVLQCGVQLMDYDSQWFSAHNVLEYFFMFKSRIHYFAKQGIVPLGGNTVFFKAADLKEIGGWDEHGLCEDADIGIRLSLKGKKFDVMYDPKHVTREETPHSAAAFIKQRTRWNQGFLQILAKSEWKGLPTFKQTLLLFYVMCSPTFMTVIMMATPFLLAIGFFFKLQVLISFMTFIPLFLSLFVLLMNLLGLHEFGKDQRLHIKLRSYLFLIITFIPYQVLLVISAARALSRELRGNRGWEKTVHLGSHRTAATAKAAKGAVRYEQA